MRLKTILSSLVLLACSPLWAEGIVGDWTLTIDTPRGVQHPTMQVNEDLTGNYNSLRGPIAIEKVTVDGNSFSFPLTITVPIGEITVNYAGEVDGDKLSGLVKSPRGEVPFSGVRSQ